MTSVSSAVSNNVLLLNKYQVVHPKLSAGEGWDLKQKSNPIILDLPSVKYIKNNLWKSDQALEWHISISGHRCF